MNNINRNKDLTQVFDERWKANKVSGKEVNDRVKDFNLRMYGIKSKEEKRKELREANSIESRVDRLTQNMNSAFSIYNSNRGNKGN